jgi:hypothetical protein
MSFTDEEIRALVGTGQYRDPEAEAWIARCLIARRDRIGRTYFKKVLPLDNFRVEKGKIAFDNLEAKHGFAEAPGYNVQWSRFDNDTEKHVPIGTVEAMLEIPPIVELGKEGVYVAAKVWAEDPEKTVNVYLRKQVNSLPIFLAEVPGPQKLLGPDK